MSKEDTLEKTKAIGFANFQGDLSVFLDQLWQLFRWRPVVLYHFLCIRHVCYGLCHCQKLSRFATRRRTYCPYLEGNTSHSLFNWHIHNHEYIMISERHPTANQHTTFSLENSPHCISAILRSLNNSAASLFRVNFLVNVCRPKYSSRQYLLIHKLISTKEWWHYWQSTSNQIFNNINIQFLF